MTIVDDVAAGKRSVIDVLQELIAQSTSYQIPDRFVAIDGYLIDAALSENYQFDSAITDHPVETGSDVTSNVRVLPAVVTITGVVSDTPIGTIAGTRALEAASGANGGGNPSDAVIAKLLQIRDQREPITIKGSKKTFDNMLMQSLVIPIDDKTGNATHFTATFKEVILVTNDRQFVRVAIPNAGKKVSLGNKPSVDQPGGYYSVNNAEGADTSLLGSIVDSAGVKNKIAPSDIPAAKKAAGNALMKHFIGGQ